MTKTLLAATALVSIALSACNSSRNVSATNGSLSDAEPRVAVTETRAGTIYRQEIDTPNGDILVVQVFEPTELEAGKSYPLVLNGHGYGGTRQQTASGFIQRLIDTGYYVISIDQLGFGESGGTVRVMSPDFEGQALIALLDWAENLEGLARRPNGEMLVGSYGGSYGGMYQLLLYAADPKHRLRVMAPNITPHDLTYSLNPNGVVKSGWGLALIAGGETNLDPARGNLRQDPAIPEILINAGLYNEFSEAGFNFMRYHSMKYFCDGEPAGPQSFILAEPDPLLVPPETPPAADVLIAQGFLDTLFNFNEGLNNYECLKGLGGDVRLLTHQSGHILPLSLSTAGLEDPLDPFYQALTVPEFQDAGASGNCGNVDMGELQFAWFEEKLRGQAGAVDTVYPADQGVCLSLAEGDAVTVDAVQRGGQPFAIGGSTPQLNSLVGLIGSVMGTEVREALLADMPVYTAPAGGAVIAGIPTLKVDISGLSGAEMTDCVTTPVSLACDPIVFVGIGHRPAGQTRWEAVDDQITPVRGFGQHDIELNGIAERLNEGDELAMLVYAFHAQFPVSPSRDLFVPAMGFSGELQLPILDASAQ